MIRYERLFNSAFIQYTKQRLFQQLFHSYVTCFLFQQSIVLHQNIHWRVVACSVKHSEDEIWLKDGNRLVHLLYTQFTTGL